MKKILRSTFSIFSITTVCSLFACSGINDFSWKEEVKLDSGEVILVQRTAKAREFGEVGGAGGWENEGMTVKIIQPNLPDIPPLWDARFVPIVFDRDPKTKDWVMIATFYTCESWFQIGRPALPYTEYRLKDNAWVQQTPIDSHWIGRKANMLTAIRSSGEPDHTLQSKFKIMDKPTIAPEYTEIVGKWTTGC